MLQRVNVEVVLRRKRLQMKDCGVAALWCFGNASVWIPARRN